MRVIAHIPHPSITITLFHMNDKFIIKMEAGPMEQVFKISQTEIGGVEEIKKMLDEKFMQAVLVRFNEMYLSLKEARNKYDSNQLKKD